MNHPKMLWDLGVRGAVNLCGEYGGPVAAYGEVGIKQLRLPSVDHFEVPVEYMHEAVRFLQAHKKRNEKVYVHCKAGHGRAASIALCWMISENRDMNPEVSDIELLCSIQTFTIATAFIPSMAPQELNMLLAKKRKVRKTLFKQPNVLKFYDDIQAEEARKKKSIPEAASLGGSTTPR